MLLSASFAFSLGCTSAPQSTSTTTTTPPLVYPGVNAISPGKVAAGTATTVLTVTGTNFLATSSVQVGGIVEATTFASSTQLTASVPAAQLVNGSFLPIIVSNGTTTSASSTAINPEVDNPLPVIASLLSSTLAAGSVPGTVSVTGTGFTPQTAVSFNGSAVTTTYVPAVQQLAPEHGRH